MAGLDQWIAKCNLTGSIAALCLCEFFCGIVFWGCSLNLDKSAAVRTRGGNVEESATPVPSAALGKARTPNGRVSGVEELSVREEHGQTILFVRFSQPVTEFRHFQLPQPARIILDVLAAANRPAPSDSFTVETNWVATVRLSSGEHGVRLTTDIAAATVPPYTIGAEDGGLKIVIGPLDANARTKQSRTLVRAGMRTDLRAAETLSSEPVQNIGRNLTSDDIVEEQKKYAGEKISLEFKDADIKNVLRILAEVSGKNLVVTDDVNRKVTIRLVEVPWDQALDLILGTNGLVKEEMGNVVRISTAGRLKSDRDQQDTAGTLQTAYFTVNYARVMRGRDDKEADKDLVEKIKLVLSRDGKVEADQRTNTLIVRDTKNGIERAQSFLAKLDKRTPQVLIESNLIETTPTFARSLGAELDFTRGGAQVDSRFLAGEPFAGSLTSFNPEVPTTLNEGLRLGLFQNRFGPFRNLNYTLTAAESEGNLKIITRPTVVTLNNVESSIEIGEVIRVKTSAATVGESGSIREFRAGIALTVTPQVSADGFVLLRITAKTSEFDFSKTVDNIPRELTREARANVLVKNGETVVIGGIQKDRNSESETGVPYLKNVPVLGWLFKKSTWTKDFTELMVFITPRITEAGSENLPSAEQLWRNQLEQTTGSPANTNKP
jgi:type IV pilus secretin PilQ/predicted competence protein